MSVYSYSDSSPLILIKTSLQQIKTWFQNRRSKWKKKRPYESRRVLAFLRAGVPQHLIPSPTESDSECKCSISENFSKGIVLKFRFLVGWGTNLYRPLAREENRNRRSIPHSNTGHRRTQPRFRNGIGKMYKLIRMRPGV